MPMYAPGIFCETSRDQIMGLGTVIQEAAAALCPLRRVRAVSGSSSGGDRLYQPHEPLKQQRGLLPGFLPSGASLICASTGGMHRTTSTLEGDDSIHSIIYMMHKVPNAGHPNGSELRLATPWRFSSSCSQLSLPACIASCCTGYAACGQGASQRLRHVLVQVCQLSGMLGFDSRSQLKT